MGDWGALGHPEPLLELDLIRGALSHEVADHGGSKWRGTSRDELDRTEVLGLDVVVGSQEAAEWRDQVQEGGAVRDQSLDVHVGLELGQGDHLEPKVEAHDHDGGHGVDSL